MVEKIDSLLQEFVYAMSKATKAEMRVRTTGRLAAMLLHKASS